MILQTFLEIFLNSLSIISPHSKNYRRFTNGGINFSLNRMKSKDHLKEMMVNYCTNILFKDTKHKEIQYTTFNFTTRQSNVYLVVIFHVRYAFHEFSSSGHSINSFLRSFVQFFIFCFLFEYTNPTITFLSNPFGL